MGEEAGARARARGLGSAQGRAAGDARHIRGRGAGQAAGVVCVYRMRARAGWARAGGKRCAYVCALRRVLKPAAAVSAWA